jgi:PKD repeat protein
MFEKRNLDKNKKGFYKDKNCTFKNKARLRLLLISSGMAVLSVFLIMLVSCCFSFNLNSSPSTEEQQFWNETDPGQTDTAQTALEQSTELVKPDLAILSKLKISGQAIDVKALGGYAYLTNDLGILYVIDVKDKENPAVVGKISGLNAANIVMLQGDYAYISYTEWIDPNATSDSTQQDDQSGTNNIYSKCGFKIIDIRDKKNPKLAGDYISGDNKKKSVQGLVIDGSYAYLNSTVLFEDHEESALEIIDIKDKANPALVGSCPVEGQPNGLFVQGDYAYANNSYYDFKKDDYSGKSSFLVINIKDKKKPVVAGSCEVPANSWSVYARDSFAYLSSSTYDEDTEQYLNSYLQVIDISSPENPSLAGKCSIPGGAWELDMKDNFLFVSNNEGGILAVDISDSKNPAVVANLNTGGNSYDIAISGDFGYIADGFAGLAILTLQKKTSGEGTSADETSWKGNKPPVADIAVSGDKLQKDVYINENPVFFNAADSYDPEGKELTYTWTLDSRKLADEGAFFKDSISQIQFAVSEKSQELACTFNKPGEYEISLTVSDGEFTDQESVTVTVMQQNLSVNLIKEHVFDVKIECILKNNSKLTLKDLECYLRTPQAFFPFQKINDIKASQTDVDQVFDDSGNMLTHFMYDKSVKVSPGQQYKASITANVSMYEYDFKTISSGNKEYEPDDEDLRLYTGEDLFIDIYNPAIVSAAKKATGSETDPVLKAKKIYNYITSKLAYDYSRAADRDYEYMNASEILKIGKGVCADYAILYTALLRASGIPARVAAGIPSMLILDEKDKTIDIGHAWTEVKLPGYGWIPVDITQEEGFMKTDYYMNIATEKGTSFLYESQTMDWTSYFFDGFKYKWDGTGSDASLVDQRLYYSIKNLSMEDLSVYK